MSYEAGPYCVIADDAQIGDGTRLGAHVVVHAGTVIGAGCEVQDGAVLGKPPKLARHSTAPATSTGKNRSDSSWSSCETFLPRPSFRSTRALMRRSSGSAPSTP